ncbi:pyruvate ferredoxin oxidoreductase delta subunit [Papillibacter cinnamivorans DSM 12816]|uniref:Pyruvate ferredoxin oxidoreductase delta subunit n=2 Tax=Papillibacter TaxID=100175 RepID=A0A1W2D1M6_9FIRM|nr:4Fe-4S binding protein [Papillibacter cinnamivorans]SMC91477.1 pyruvate ferredoxin oxidoreductase delta subunit [Papillibacter cinnamivorans DSM 12816]
MIPKASEINERSSWKEMTQGGEIAGGGTARLVETGQWRSRRPVHLTDKCRQCLLCVPCCPDSSIPVQNGRRSDFDLMHCKGCGICAKVCPFGAIQMCGEVEE